jgi:4-nitrophenyl phosphatase
MNIQIDASKVEILRHVRGLVLDLDGVLHVGPEPVDRLPEFMDFIQRRAIQITYVTNNSTLSSEELSERLSVFGIKVDPDQILNSAIATAKYLAQALPAGGQVLVVGEKGLVQAVEEAGFEVGDDHPQAVAVGLDRQITYEKIAKAASAVSAGARFVACNVDSGAPKPDGIAPGAGAMVAAIQAVTNETPLIIGKPEPTMFLEAAAQMGLAPQECAAVGDRLDVDIVCAKRAGMIGVLVLSGMTTLDLLQDSTISPDLVFNDIVDMVEKWDLVLDG